MRLGKILYSFFPYSELIYFFLVFALLASILNPKQYYEIVEINRLKYLLGNPHMNN